MFCSSGQYTALYLAAYNGRTTACQLLIASNADVNATDRCAFTFKFCYWFCCIILLLATHSPICSDGMTPLKRAIDMNKLDVVALLRSVGAAE
jgi:hypothetical protein